MKILICFLLLTTYSPARSITVEKQPRYGDRFYISNVLNNIFGPKSSTIIKKSILNYPEVFGGPCSLMEEVLVEDKEADSPKQVSSEFTCREGLAESKIPMFTRTALIRNSHMHKACSLLTGDPDLVRYVLLNTGTAQDKKELTKSLVKKFYPYMESIDSFSEKVLQKFDEVLRTNDLKTNLIFNNFILLDIASEQAKDEISFKNLLYLLCISEEWQIP